MGSPGEVLRGTVIQPELCIKKIPPGTASEELAGEQELVGGLAGSHTVVQKGYVVAKASQRKDSGLGSGR